MINDLTLLTCNYNNSYLTLHMLESFYKWVQYYIPTVIVDNSNKTPINDEFKKYFTIIDNTYYKLTEDYKQISHNHAASIDYALKNVIKTKYVLLCDNDILFKNDVIQLLDTYNDYDVIGEISHDWTPPARLLPYFCIINVEKFKQENLNYFEKERCMIKIPNTRIKTTLKGFEHNSIFKNVEVQGYLYDTGASFYEDIQYSWNIKKIELAYYITHLKYGSHTEDMYINKEETIEQFFKNNKDLLII